MSNPYDPYGGGNSDDHTRRFDPVDPGNTGHTPRSPRDWETTSAGYGSGYSDTGRGAQSGQGSQSNQSGQSGYTDSDGYGQGEAPVTHYEKVSADLDEALDEVATLRTYKTVALIAAPAAIVLGILTVILLMTQPSGTETVITGVDGQPTTTTVPAETTTETTTRTVDNEVTQTQTATLTQTATETATQTVTETPEAVTTTVTTTPGAGQ